MQLWLARDKLLVEKFIFQPIPGDGKDGYELEIPYEEEMGDVTSRDTEELRKCLHNGQIPEAYEKVITKIEVKEVRRKKKSDQVEEEITKSLYGTEEEMKERAKEGYFVRDPEKNVVFGRSVGGVILSVCAFIGITNLLLFGLQRYVYYIFGVFYVSYYLL